MYEDIYFLNPVEALRVATEQNRWGENNYFLQVCYYDGEKIESDLVNLIHLPIDNLLEGLAYGTLRIPSKIDFEGLELSDEIKVNVELNFNMSIQQVQMYRNQFNAQYLHKMKNSAPDFSEPLRFYLSASSSTQVMQYVSKNIADTLQAMGYDVLFELSHGMEDTSSLKNMSEFNPHATINVNHLHNSFLNDAVFNFVWFQDGMPILLNEEIPFIRGRDHIFVLVKGLKELLNKKGIESELLSFMMNENIYKSRDEIKKDKKIVFIGRSYAGWIEHIKNDVSLNEIYKDALEIFEEKSYLKNLSHQDSEIRFLMEKYNKTKEYIDYIYMYLMRDYCVEKLCTINTDYEIEIYGHGWSQNPIVAPYFKGIVEYGEDISKIYNSATYGYCPGGYVLMQRTLECAFSETIPLVLDVRADKQDVYNEKIEESIEFFHIKDLELIISREPQEKRYDFIKEQYGYKHFVNRCIEIMNEELS